MQSPLAIQFDGMEPSPAVEAAVREKIARIERQAPDVMGWRVTIEQPHRHRSQGRPFAVRIDVRLAGHDLSVGRVEDEDVYVALRDAFDAMRRRIEDAVQIQRGDVKRHEEGQ
jgi:ribosome-associated translation inhibitor RaiA